MKQFTIEDHTYEVVDFLAEEIHGTPTFTILEGEFAGKMFILSNMHMDETDEGLMHYNIDAHEDVDVDLIQPLVDNIILYILYEQLERVKNEDSEITSNT